MAKKTAETAGPKFPYTTQPKALRRLLEEIPKRPKPPKINMATLKGWDVSSNNNASTAIGVLKKIGLLGSAAEPTTTYVDFMKTGTGPAVLAERIKDTYQILFQNSLAPQNESDEELRKLFNIHSGGGDDAMRYQVQTFKALCDYANFGSAPGAAAGSAGTGAAPGSNTGDAKLPAIEIDLHIHLPENKTTRDYEAIIQDIAKYIYGRNIEKS
jgi:Family of unknown function (DUF5343)